MLVAWLSSSSRCCSRLGGDEETLLRRALALSRYYIWLDLSLVQLEFTPTDSPLLLSYSRADRKPCSPLEKGRVLARKNEAVSACIEGTTLRYTRQLDLEAHERQKRAGSTALGAFEPTKESSPRISFGQRGEEGGTLFASPLCPQGLF